MPTVLQVNGAVDGWLMARAAGRVAEMAARRPDGKDALRAIVREFDGDIARDAAPQRSAFLDWSRDAAEAFGDADAAAATQPILNALVEGIKIIDDIQDGEARCLAAEIGIAPALNAALGAFARALDLTADLQWPDASWRAALAAIASGIRDTAAGQQLEASADGTFETYWEIVDAKSPPLVATALELGALSAGAGVERARALTRIARPLARLLQVGDDCNDALGDGATDWRAPHLNLLMLYSLSGPRGAELAALLRGSADLARLREAQLFLLRDGALAYAVHVQIALFEELDATIQSLALPNPLPFQQLLQRQREASERLLRQSGVDEDVTARVMAYA
jgi:hypothetical protein